MGDTRLPEEIEIRDQNAPVGHRVNQGTHEATSSPDEDELELIHGSGHVFRDLNLPDADREHLRAVLAARIMRVMDDEHLTVRAAQDRTGIAAADFSRIRKAKLGRFTIDRLMIILDRLGQNVDITVTVTPRTKGQITPGSSDHQSPG